MSADISTREGLFAVMRQIAAEREAAKPLVAALIAREELPWDEDIPQEWKTAGFVEELTKAAAGMVERDWQKTVELLSFAIPLIENVGGYPSIVIAYNKGQLWRERAYAQRLASYYDQSVKSFEVAERVLLAEPVLLHDVARARYSKGAAFGHQGNYEKFAELLDWCESVFQSYGDCNRITRCQIARGIISLWRGDYATAAERFRSVIDLVRAEDDLHTLGVVYNDLGQALTHLGKLDEAETAIRSAREIYVNLAMPTEVNRLDWAFGYLLLVRGEYSRALTIFETVRNFWLEQEMIEGAGIAGLDAVDALLALGRDEEARRLKQQVSDEFRYANLKEPALRALAYLQEFLPRGERGRDAVQHVKAFVERQRSNPAAVFEPMRADEKSN